LSGEVFQLTRNRASIEKRETRNEKPSMTDPSERFQQGALRRIPRFLALAAVPAVALAWRIAGPAAGIGVLAGAVAAFANFRALVASVEALGARVTGAGGPESGARIIMAFLLRYLLMAVIAYGIFSGSRTAFYGFLAGLCLPVAALLAEAACEFYVAFRRGR
jgi:hypothetical protein